MLKYASGADSLVKGVSQTIYDDEDKINDISPIDPYYFGILVFGFFSLYFSFGNIENSKVLQMATSIIRVVVVALIYFGCFYDIHRYGTHIAPVFNWSEQLTHLSTTFGNTVFVFIYHHSIGGIIYPIRP